MRRLPLLAACLLAAPAGAAELTPEQSARLAIEHFLSHEPGQRILYVGDKLPVNDAHAERISRAQVAIRDVEAGCVKPCTEPAEIALYAGRIDYAAENLRMSPEELEAARRRYMPEGRPRLRPDNVRGNDIDREYANLGGVVDRAVIERLMSRRSLPPQVRQSLASRSQRMVEALGRTLGPGEAGTGSGQTAAVLAMAGTTLGQTRQSLQQFSSLPQAQSDVYQRLSGTVPDMPRRTEDPRLEAHIRRAQAHFAQDPSAQQTVRWVLTKADEDLRRGVAPSGPLFERFFPIASYENKLNLLASDRLKSLRSDYGGGSAALPANLVFARQTGISAGNETLADVDHFFYAAGTGAAGPGGTIACVGMSAIWDGVVPTAQYAWRVVSGAVKSAAALDGSHLGRATDTRNLRYNYGQLGTDMRGCSHGAQS